MSNLPVKSFDRRKFFLGLSIGSLALAGLLAAGGVFIGGETWKASTTAGLVFLLNMLVLISFVSRHSILRFAQWIAIPIIGVLSAFFIWAERPSVAYLIEPWNAPRSGFDAARDWSMGLWWLVVAFALLSFFSKTWPLIRGNVFLRGTYIFTVGITLLAALIAWINSGTDSLGSDGLVLVESVLAILALTGASIVIIAAFVERSRLKGEAVKETSGVDQEHLTALIDSRVEAYLLDPINREKILRILTSEIPEDSSDEVKS